MKIIFTFFLIIISINSNAQTVNIPDVNLKNALVNDLVVDTNFDGIGDDDVDTNDDGEIQIVEAQAVEYLYLSGKNIVMMNGIEEFINLLQLDVSFNDIEILDLSGNIILNSIDCSNNVLSTINVTQSTELTSLRCNNNLLSSLDITQNIELFSLECNFNQLESLDISNNVDLEYLRLTNNQLTQIDITNNVNLFLITFRQNNLQELDLSQNINLTFLEVTFNNLSALDTSNNNLLRRLLCGVNSLTELDFTNNPLLSNLSCSVNNITSLDTSILPNLSRLSCYGIEELTYLNIKNGNNSNMDVMWADDNPNLSCIIVDDPIFANTKTCGYPTTGWCKDENTVYADNEECILSVPQNDFFTFTLFPNPTSNFINFKSNQTLESIMIYDMLGKKQNSTISSNSINVTNLFNGIYILEVSFDNKKYFYKFIKE
jgi:Leucine-rich repeat (LRR) protein